MWADALPLLYVFGDQIIKVKIKKSRFWGIGMELGTAGLPGILA
jgi:hypothetical protein